MQFTDDLHPVCLRFILYEKINIDAVSDIFQETHNAVKMFLQKLEQKPKSYKPFILQCSHVPKCSYSAPTAKKA